MRFFAMILAFWAFAVPVQAQDNKAIEDVIGQQLQAFTDRDVAAAWEHASPMIQGMFGNSARFGQMVEQGYPMVWDNRDAAFMELEGSGQLVLQKVFIRDAEGAGWVLSYAMLETDAGWKINGVSVVPAPELSA
ncbi:DUF4864 domain-containing protein [Yoonia sp. R2331]|uniref:DUF4864 domain-containing protein n=1 Tax=Yoonia sp. R2331 TaxID=3237238 RepID=UPI0034E56B9B